jgi:hypothetical protein
MAEGFAGSFSLNAEKGGDAVPVVTGGTDSNEAARNIRTYLSL